MAGKSYILKGASASAPVGGTQVSSIVLEPGEAFVAVFVGEAMRERRSLDGSGKLQEVKVFQYSPEKGVILEHVANVVLESQHKSNEVHTGDKVHVHRLENLKTEAKGKNPPANFAVTVLERAPAKTES